jgi:hypothetical protein
MKKAIAIIVSVLFVFAITSLSFAAEKKAHAKVKQVTGEVTAAEDKMVKDIMAGDKVVVKYTEADGKNTAKSVKKAAKKAAKKAEPAENK